MSSNPIFRTRQAPSPTGYLHLGTARQILFTILFAKKNAGEWYLRLEDTDRNRLVQDSPKQFLETLLELGISVPEGINLENGDLDKFYDIKENGKYSSYIQSKRLPIYHDIAQRMIDKKLAYWSYLSEEEKQELQEIKKINKKSINYYQYCLQKDGVEKIFQSLEAGLSDDKKPTLRYRMQRPKTLICEDLLIGKSNFNLNLEEDFTILKSDGYPTYHLAHLVDDFLMLTSLVIRSQEWYPSIAKNITMFHDFWGEMSEEELDEISQKYNFNWRNFVSSKNGRNVPDYIHLPFIMGETGNKKMSKRDGNVNMQSYLDQGFLPEAILNYLAFLGWNPGTDKEMYL